ncbi:sugar kinase [Gordonia sp. NPDC058843]|uniref:sugar kinase n=1 Tax=Gordonia sp. NPDC058843 TaxID=3346648 RepID=UPI003693F3BD
MSPARVAVIGETMLALRSAGQLALNATLTTSIAGAESNVAIGLSRLGHPVSWIGRVGSDAPGDVVLKALRAEGVDVSGAQRDSAGTGMILFDRRLPAVSRVAYARTGSAGSALSPADIDLDDGVAGVHVSGVTPALSESAGAAVQEAFAQARRRGAWISFDINYRARLWSKERARAVLEPFVRGADVVIASPDELALFGSGSGAEAAGTQDAESVAAELIVAGVREVVVKNGAESAFVVTGSERAEQPALRVEEVDPIGAGDGFVAGYLSALLDGAALDERLRRAHKVGAFAVSSVGDWEGLPTRAELDLIGSAGGSVMR